MNANKPRQITVQTNIQAPMDKVWECWTNPEHITHWNFANDEWCCPSATNELRQGGEFIWRMEAKDGSVGFDFTGTYESIKEKELITYQIADGRFVRVEFSAKDKEVTIKETFEAEETNSLDLQQSGWQAILENFKSYVEAQT